MGSWQKSISVNVFSMCVCHGQIPNDSVSRWGAHAGSQERTSRHLLY